MAESSTVLLYRTHNSGQNIIICFTNFQRKAYLSLFGVYQSKIVCSVQVIGSVRQLRDSLIQLFLVPQDSFTLNKLAPLPFSPPSLIANKMNVLERVSV
jgi:hypothetical protein